MKNCHIAQTFPKITLSQDLMQFRRKPFFLLEELQKVVCNNSTIQGDVINIHIGFPLKLHQKQKIEN